MIMPIELEHKRDRVQEMEKLSIFTWSAITATSCNCNQTFNSVLKLYVGAIFKIYIKCWSNYIIINKIYWHNNSVGQVVLVLLKNQDRSNHIGDPVLISKMDPNLKNKIQL